MLDHEIIFQIHAHLLAADNPAAAELTSTAGSQARHWCRCDNSGGTTEHRETNDGYDALFKVRIELIASARTVSSHFHHSLGSYAKHMKLVSPFKTSYGQHAEESKRRLIRSRQRLE